ncbi:arylamine N-acetyltransferase [Streptomyces sp. NPDC046887]|uniref:arylamine N-acetyltransferase family protein n=1 Tax=Streptomyces sp. NPDC046887 TaxID=3155472 RepID=UPI0033D1C4BC
MADTERTRHTDGTEAGERTEVQGFDLDAYLRGIGWEGPRRADLATLRGVHWAHLRAVPFENLDSFGGTAPSLRPAELMAKLVHGRRGGYCFEQNTLFALALRALGFTVTTVGARVTLGASTVESRPRTHMALKVEIPGAPRPYLADAGFGSVGGLAGPIPLTTGEESRDRGRRHRLVHLPHDGPLELWALQAYVTGAAEDEEAGYGPGDTPGDAPGDRWTSQYAFTLDPFEPVDAEVSNWYVATHPHSPFVHRPFAQRTVSDGHHLSLDARHLVETHPDGTVTERDLADEVELRRVLDERFGITVPEGLTLLPTAG